MSDRRSLLIRAGCIFSIVCIAATQPATADGESTPESLEKARLEVEAQRLSNAKTLQDLLSVRGAAELADIAIEPEILGQQAIRKIAEHIESMVSTNNATSVVIHDKAVVDSIAKYGVARLRLSSINDGYTATFDQCKPPELAARSGVSLLAAALGFFKSDIKIKGEKGSSAEESLVAEIARALRKGKPEDISNVGTQMLYPKLYLPARNEDKLKFECPATKDNVSITQELACASKNRAKGLALVVARKPPDKCVESVEALNKEFDQIWADLMNVRTDTGSSGFSEVLFGEAMESLLPENAKILFLKIIAQGGNNKSNSHIFWTTLSHSGGAVVSYMILQRGAGISWGETLHYYTEYVNASAIPKCNFADRSGKPAAICGDDAGR